ncbi:hypothetical protein A3I34_01375 [Candidatus Jorgensenbacteria bacterium RIFCSPLOWO2_02_FULL_45_12]|nr:MAG: hypothetical protein A3D55_02050 [Candidatus Jorgensenbacteria bacterium RIFCSPHIGHO2_02_FULL_45_20]OGG42678.1 MAG: hypothetical protein A3I34_01375 [Candidatus Jorgensenbacteria bacterium RIFCSPLOWO2_02_FULL_45_12]
MRLLIISQFFPPETNAAAHRIGFLAEKLSENKDNDVTVICEPPNYPKGVLFDGYKNSLFSAEKKGNITIIRSWVRITARRDFINRIVTYFSFFFSGLLAGTRVPKPDVVFASAPPLPVLFSGFIISKLRGVSLVSEVRDIWPDSVVAVGMMKKGVLFKILESCEKTVYRGSSAVIVNADGIRRRLIKDKGVSPEKTVVIRNGADLDLFSGAPNPNIIDEQYGTKNKFVVLFSGLIGLAQSPEVVIRAAELLRGEEDVVFMLVGEGVLKKQSEETAKQFGLKNVIFAGERPRSDMPMFCARAGVGLATYKKSDLFRDVIPSKIYDYMGAGIPVIINLEGEGSRLVKEAECGLVAEEENPESLAEKIMEIKNNSARARDMGARGRKYAEKHLNKAKLAAKLEKILESKARGA